MISLIEGVIVTRDLDRVEVMTGGGTGYELQIPLSTFERLPPVGANVRLHTHLVVKDDGWLLFGFVDPYDRKVFHRLLGATGFGPALALAALSTLSAPRVARAIRERDVATLQAVPRVGRKKAERLILDLGEKMDDLQQGDPQGPPPQGAGAEDAVRALVSLGYSQPDAERAVRAAIEALEPGVGAAELIRGALARVK